MTDLFIKLGEMQEANLDAIRCIRDEVQHLFELSCHDRLDLCATLKPLFHYIFSRSQTISFLISHRIAWDAEIILRSFYETAAKILFICSAEPGEQDILCKEFWDDFDPIGNRRTAQKAKFAEFLFDPESISAKVFQVLQDEKNFNFSQTGNKAYRKALEQKWSFSEIINSLDQRSHKGKKFKGIKSLLHTYGLASHLLHADKFALDLMRDRATRQREELLILECAHLARMMSDQAFILWLCAENLRETLDLKFSVHTQINEKCAKVSDLGSFFTKIFDDNQRNFYEKMDLR